jgi:thioredoxin-like negative regulator of GroEL
MQSSTLITRLLFACLLLLGRLIHAAEPSIVNDELLQSARLWEARHRGDLARLALEKLVTARPDSPDALLELGELNLRMSDFVATERVLLQLEQRFKDSPAARSMRTRYRLATRDRLQWLAVQRLAQLERGREVRRELDRLFPQGPPEGPVAIEYFQLLAGTPGGRQPALRGLRDLVARNPGDPRYQTALERLQGHTVAATQPLTRRPSTARTNISAPPKRAPHPGAVAAASAWEQRSRAATDAQQLQLASAQLQAASAFRAEDYEATIPVATTLDSLGYPAQAGELLASAARLAPQSTWLFETYVRWLIAHGDTSGALSMLDSRPLDEKWTADSRDTLRAAALDARARAAIASSQEEAAIPDLTEAIRLQPTDPWTRYRLATILAHQNRIDAGRGVMEEGARLAPDNPRMRFAQALYLESTDAPAEAFAVIDAVPAEYRDSDMNSLRDRTQLKIVTQLIDAGETVQARAQLADIRARADPDDLGVQLNIAYREYALGNFHAAAELAGSLARVEPERADIAMLAARANHAQRDFGTARDYFKLAESSGDADTVLTARQVREQIETRLHNWTSFAAEWRHKPGDSGISSFDSIVIPSFWHHARNYEQRWWLQADAVSVDAGKLSADFETAASLGSIRAAGPTAARPFTNDAQNGLAVGVGFVTDTFAADIGCTPLGFELPQLVGGFEWRPDVPDVAVSLGFSRRAVTSSVLSYAGMRDPVSGTRWGGVVQTGPYMDAGIYRERFSIAGALRFTEVTGERVLDNQFFGARVGGDWKFYSEPHLRASLGLTINYWQFDHNLQNYTLGSGGYYSPQSYVSVALPLEVWGETHDWSYRLRASVSHTNSERDAIAAFPNDPVLQAAAGAPTFGEDSSSGVSLSAYAAIERQLSSTWIAGAKLDIDRADFYEPTVFMLYVRHAFAPWTTRIAVPPRPLQPYNEK